MHCYIKKKKKKEAKEKWRKQKIHLVLRLY